ncbi:MAG: PEGA domain-containing protein [Candidatus Shapirobacteria bacterium]|jgi:hypothetical protein
MKTRKPLMVAGLVFFLGWILGGCSLIPRKASIEIMSVPSAKVHINGKEAGMTPYKNSSLMPGEIEIKLTAVNQEWSKKIILQNNVNTVVDWNFDKNENLSGGYVLYMEKTGDLNRAGLLINATPDKSAVHIDGQIKGFSPLRIDEIGEGDRQITISYPAYKTANVFVKAIKGYQLIIEADLGNQPEEVVIEENRPTATPVNLQKQMVIIKKTETGWLRVRNKADAAGEEISKVKPDEEYQLVEEKTDWMLIDLGDGKQGWISAKYAEKI